MRQGRFLYHLGCVSVLLVPLCSFPWGRCPADIRLIFRWLIALSPVLVVRIVSNRGLCPVNSLHPSSAWIRPFLIFPIILSAFVERQQSLLSSLHDPRRTQLRIKCINVSIFADIFFAFTFTPRRNSFTYKFRNSFSNSILKVLIN